MRGESIYKEVWDDGKLSWIWGNSKSRQNRGSWENLKMPEESASNQLFFSGGTWAPGACG